MKKIITKNYKYLIGLTVGIFISIGVVYASSYFGAGSDLNYDNSESGLISTNVQDALEELHKVKKTGCPIGYACEEHPIYGKTASNAITHLYENGTKTNVTTAGGEAITQVTDQNLMKDSFGNIRYYGANPNNYVKFNNELWRIISVGNVKANESDTTGETRIKIIRNESIGKFSWDSSASGTNSGRGVNDWSQADLKTELNTIYYNSQKGTCYNGQNNVSTTCDFTSSGLGSEARSMLDEVLYYLGGVPDVQLYANNYYTFERGETVYTGRPTKWTGTLAVMYPSDYAYAADLSKCEEFGYQYSYYTTNCAKTDWLKISASQWMLSPRSDSTSPDVAFGIASAGNDNPVTLYTYAVESVRPVAYLKSSVKITGGEGTQEKPYELSLS